EHCARHMPPEEVKNMEKSFAMLANADKTVKHPTKEMIVARKKCEKIIDQLYQTCLDEMRQVFTRVGYISLLPLEDEESLVLWGSNSGNPESPADNGVPYSEILCSKWVEEDELYAFTDIF